MGNVWSQMFARVKFTALGGRYERFVTMCAEQGIPVSGMKAVPGGLKAEMPARYYRQAAGYARRCRTRLKVQRKIGFWFWLRRYKGRWGLLLGPVAFFAVLLSMQQMVWAIRYDETISPSQQSALRQALYSMDIYEGSFLTQEKVRQSEKILLSQSQKLGWVSLNFGKGRLVVEAVPAALKPIIEGDEVQDLYAKADGLILDMNVQEGFAVRQQGQTVAQGDTLVTAGKPDRNEQYIATHAQGTVTAKIQRTYQCVQPLEYTALVPTGKIENNVTLCMGNRRVPIGKTEEMPQAEYRMNHRPLSIMGFALPATVEEELIVQRTPKTIVLSEKQAQQYARFSCLQQLYKEFPDAQIIKHKEEDETEGNKLIHTIWMEITANIAASREE